MRMTPCILRLIYECSYIATGYTSLPKSKIVVPINNIASCSLNSKNGHVAWLGYWSLPRSTCSLATAFSHRLARQDAGGQLGFHAQGRQYIECLVTTRSGLAIDGTSGQFGHMQLRPLQPMMSRDVNLPAKSYTYDGGASTVSYGLTWT